MKRIIKITCFALTLVSLFYVLSPSQNNINTQSLSSVDNTELSDVNPKENNTELKDLKTPVYYTVFKFVLNYLPLKQAH